MLGRWGANLKEHRAAGQPSHDGERDKLLQQRKRPTVREKQHPYRALEVGRQETNNY